MKYIITITFLLTFVVILHLSWVEWTAQKFDRLMNVKCKQLWWTKRWNTSNTWWGEVYAECIIFKNGKMEKISFKYLPYYK